MKTIYNMRSSYLGGKKIVSNQKLRGFFAATVDM